jgi:hypothetical protein
MMSIAACTVAVPLEGMRRTVAAVIPTVTNPLIHIAGLRVDRRALRGALEWRRPGGPQRSTATPLHRTSPNRSLTTNSKVCMTRVRPSAPSSPMPVPIRVNTRLFPTIMPPESHETCLDTVSTTCGSERVRGRHDWTQMTLSHK